MIHGFVSGRAVLAMAAMLAVACGGTSSTTTLAGPTPVRCQVSVAAAASNFSHTGGEGTVEVSAARECTWTAASEAPWITLSAREGQGSAALKFVVASNPAPAPRSGRLQVGDQPVTVGQQPAPCHLDVQPAQVTVAAAGEERDVRVSVLAGCAWEARTDAAWLAVVAGARGEGAGTVRVRAAANGGGERRARLLVGDRAVTVTQRAHGTAPLPPDSEPAPDSPEPDPPGDSPEPDPPPEPDPDSPPSDTGIEVELEGSVSGVTGSCPNLTFKVKGTTVVTDSRTRWDDGACGDMRNGVKVEVEGRLQSDGTVLATEVEFD